MDKKFIQFIGTLFLFVMFLFMFYMFITAYNNPDKSVEVFIDRYNEAIIECFIMMPILFILGAYTLYLSYKNYFPITKK